MPTEPTKRTPPHVILVASYFYPKIGGLENYAYLLAKELQKGGRYRVTVITSNYDGQGYKKEELEGLIIHKLPISFRISNTPIGLTWYWEMKRLFKADPPQIVHVHSPVPYMADMAAAAAGKIPVVLTYHSGSLKKGSPLVDIILGFYENTFLYLLFKRADIIVPISQPFAHRKFPQFIYKMHFIPTGVDLTRFTKTPLPSGETVTFVGRIEHSSSWKGIESLLLAMVLLLKIQPTVRLEIVGGGDALDHYSKRAEELGIADVVLFAGPRTGSDLVDAYHRSNVVVLPSTSDSEAFSVVLVEAMASGRPIVGTKVGGTPQVIEEGENGLLVAPNDPPALAAAIKRILTNRNFATTLAENGFTRAKGYTWEIQAEKYNNLFQGLLKRN